MKIQILSGQGDTVHEQSISLISIKEIKIDLENNPPDEPLGKLTVIQYDTPSVSVPIDHYETIRIIPE